MPPRLSRGADELFFRWFVAQLEVLISSRFVHNTLQDFIYWPLLVPATKAAEFAASGKLGRGPPRRLCKRIAHTR